LRLGPPLACQLANLPLSDRSPMTSLITRTFDVMVVALIFVAFG
jgi:hypothetical protein